jgi:hypothetical protein
LQSRQELLPILTAVRLLRGRRRNDQLQLIPTGAVREVQASLLVRRRTSGQADSRWAIGQAKKEAGCLSEAGLKPR